MSLKLQVRTFRTEEECNAQVARLRLRDYRQVPVEKKLDEGEFQVTDGTDDPTHFGESRKSGLRWLEEE